MFDATSGERINGISGETPSISTDDRGLIVSIDPGFEHLLGMDLHDAIGSAPQYPWWPTEDRRLLSTAHDMFRSGQLDVFTGVPLPMRFLDGSGNRIAVSVRVLKRDEGLAYFVEPDGGTTWQRSWLTDATKCIRDLSKAVSKLSEEGGRPLRTLAPDGQWPLSPRENEVFELLLKGRTAKEIAEELFISPNTARNHRQRTFQKLGVRSHVALLVRFLTPPSDSGSDPVENEYPHPGLSLEQSETANATAARSR